MAILSTTRGTPLSTRAVQDVLSCTPADLALDASNWSPVAKSPRKIPSLPLSMVSIDSLKAKIAASYPDATEIQTFDISGGCGASYEVVIVSPSFEGMSTLKRHREVNARLKDEIAQLHAFSQKTYTPVQFATVNLVQAK